MWLLVVAEAGILRTGFLDRLEDRFGRKEDIVLWRGRKGGWLGESCCAGGEERDARPNDDLILRGSEFCPSKLHAPLTTTRGKNIQIRQVDGLSQHIL